MELRHAAAKARHREGEAHHPRPIKRAQHLTAGMRGDDKHRGRLNFQVGFSPYLSLQFYATAEVIEVFALPNNDLPAHCFIGAALISGKRRFPASPFAASQNSSTSSRRMSFTTRPFF